MFHQRGLGKYLQKNGGSGKVSDNVWIRLDMSKYPTSETGLLLLSTYFSPFRQAIARPKGAKSGFF
jgi:hypothetical protein